MRKKRGYGRRPKENLKKHWRLWILVFLLLSLLFILYQNLKPSVMAYARMNADSLMSTIANEALRQSLQGYEKGSEELLRYYYDDQGKMVACGIDALEIGRLSVQILSAMDQYFEEHDSLIFYVPAGAAFGDSVFVGWWPDIPVRVRLIGNADISYDRAFEAVGINQVNHRVWLDLQFVIQVSAPLMSEIMTSSRQFVLVDRTFSGDIPLIFTQ